VKRWRGRPGGASPYEPPSRPSAVLPPKGGEGTRLARLALVLGDGSYAIYILHLPATALIAHTLGYARPWLFLPAAVAASLAAGLAGRAFVEKPLLECLRGAPGRRGRAITAT
jgi:peptidoglycan/LPS O-acetylase OafA/YrhL